MSFRNSIGRLLAHSNFCFQPLFLESRSAASTSGWHDKQNAAFGLYSRSAPRHTPHWVPSRRRPLAERPPAVLLSCSSCSAAWWCVLAMSDWASAMSKPASSSKSSMLEVWKPTQNSARLKPARKNGLRLCVSAEIAMVANEQETPTTAKRHARSLRKNCAHGRRLWSHMGRWPASLGSHAPTAGKACVLRGRCGCLLG